MSLQETVSAIRRDFSQYPAQLRLFLELCPLILGPGRPVSSDSRHDGVWIAPASRRKRLMERISGHELGKLLVATLEASVPTAEKLAAICEQVFQSPAWPGTDKTGRQGVWLETGMKDFACIQCGQCCRNLDYRLELTEADYFLWQKLGRTDILEWVGIFKRRGQPPCYAIWVIPGTRSYAAVCPWLEKSRESGKWQCRIHSVKPEVCRQYPVSRKHARMTGCPAFNDGLRPAAPEESPCL